MPPLRLLLVDDSPLFLDSAVQLLSRDPEIEIVGRAFSGEEALTRVAALQPDLVLMDIAMPGMGGLEATRQIKALPKPPRVVILTLYDNPEYRAAAERAGADGFICKSDFDARALTRIHALCEPKEQPVVKNILIVDDSPTMRRMIQAALRDVPSARFLEAGNGLEAIEKLALVPINLMTLDLNMPDMHGLEVLKFVRSHQAYRAIPVVVLTTRDDETNRAAALQAGASLYLTKPFDPRAFAQRVRELL
jgi:two-component system chemotaxis response regulator CheY